MIVTHIIPPVLVGNRPAERSAGCTHVVYPVPNIYELTVAAVLEREGHDVRYRDFTATRHGKGEWQQFLGNDDSDIYIIWTVNLSIANDKKAVAALHAANDRCRMIFMGPGATFYAEKLLNNPADAVVRGEPEVTVVELIKAIGNGQTPQGIAGVTCQREDGSLAVAPMRPLITDLDSLPLPARHLLGNRQFHNPKLKTGGYTTAVTSRNCPFHCIYCVPSSLTFAREIEYRSFNGTKPPIAKRSVQSIAREMEQLSSQGIRAVGFMDDNFIWNEQRTREVCDIMRRHDMVWGCQARVDAITEPIAKMLGESGCRYIDLGIESFDDRILEYVKKGITSKQIYSAIDLLKKYGVPIKLNILIGCCPLETRETIANTLREVKRLKVNQAMFNIVSPFPGTEFYKLCVENGWLKNGEYSPTDVQRNSIVNFPHLSADEMERALRRNNLSYFLSWHFIKANIGRFTSLKEFTSAARALRIKLFG